MRVRISYKQSITFAEFKKQFENFFEDVILSKREEEMRKVYAESEKGFVATAVKTIIEDRPTEKPHFKKFED